MPGRGKKYREGDELPKIEDGKRENSLEVSRTRAGFLFRSTGTESEIPALVGVVPPKLESRSGKSGSFTNLFANKGLPPIKVEAGEQARTDDTELTP